MSDFKYKVAFALTALAISLIVPVFAVDYNPGVTPGQYVKYGNFSTAVNGTESYNELDWTKWEVTSVSGKEVSIHLSGQNKNGSTAVEEPSLVYNIENGNLNGYPTRYSIVVAGNLSQGDAIPPSSYGDIFNRTETRTYLGENRTVNILEATSPPALYSSNRTFVYDKISGFQLETYEKMTFDQITIYTYSSIVVETNIFGPVIPEFSSSTAIILLAILACALAARSGIKT